MSCVALDRGAPSMIRDLLAIVFVFLGAVANAADRPNILWLSTEDISPHLGCYGDKHARTPNLDLFAAEGILYENAFSTAPVCAPSRSAIITGVYATSLGTHHMRSMVALPPEIRPFPAYLREAGYYCTNNSKEDYNFRTPPGTWDQSNGKAHWRDRPDPKQPFFAVFNYTGTHESHIRGDEPAYSRAIAKLKPEELHEPATLELPPFYPDTPKVRAEWARYYNLVTALDHWVAKHLKDLEDEGLADNTIVFFWSDHGIGMPRGKRWLYESGIHVPLIVRLPPKYKHLLPDGKSGVRADELVSLVDLAPTVLNLAGLLIPTYMQGRAFLGENLKAEREYIFAARDRMDERYDMSRVVRTKDYSYIRNFMPWRPYAQWLNYAEQSPTMQELRRLKAEGKLTPEQEFFLQEQKPIRELYDIQADKHQLRNLFPYLIVKTSSSPQLPDGLLVELRDQMARWQGDTLDLGVVPEAVLDRRVPREMSRYEWIRSKDIHKQFVYLQTASHYASLTPGGSHGWFPTMKDKEEVVRYWTAAYGPGNLKRVLDYRRSSDEDESPTVRLAVAEYLATQYPTFASNFTRDEASQRADAGLSSEATLDLIEAYQGAKSSFDQLQAANVLDLIPDFDQHADGIRPVVERVHKKLSAKRNPSQAEGYILRVTEHLRERLRDLPKE